MARTGLTLFADMAEPPLAEVPVSIKKGRNDALLAQRDERLFHRFIYYCMHTKLRHEAVLGELEKEFDLTETRLLAIVYANASELQAMRKNPPTIGQLRNKYPHMVWASAK